MILNVIHSKFDISDTQPKGAKGQTLTAKVLRRIALESQRRTFITAGLATSAVYQL